MKFLKFAVAAVLAAAVAFSFSFGLGQINYADKKLTGAENYKCIISLWHIDTFEGGVGSRAEFLLSRAAAFEKKNKGVFVMVTAHTVESAKERYAAGEMPDLVSYGYGVEPEGVSPIDGASPFKYGEYDGKPYALPWCKGGYVLLANKEVPGSRVLKNAVVSRGELTQPFAAAAFSGYTLENPSVKRPSEAYYAFITGAADYLVGTQRDVNRVLSRGAQAEVVPLSEFNDLYQYISVTAKSSEKKYYACAYVDYILSQEVQRQLNKIGMLSAYYAPEHEAEELRLMQNAENACGLSVFTARAVYDEFYSSAVKAAAGDEAAFKFLKNIVI